MKTKFSKKVLSCALALTMVLTSLVFVPMSALASTYSLSDLSTLMESYETKVSGDLTTNEVTAYEAWYDAYTTYIGVKAGTLDASKIDTAYSALNAAINNMTTWNAYTGTAVGSFSGDSTTPDNTGVYKNLLYSPQTTASVGSATVANVILNVYYPETVMLYDGITAPQMGVMASGIVNASKSRYVYSVYPCVSTSDQNDFQGLALPSYWKASTGTTMDFTWCYFQGDTSAYSYATGNNGIGANSTDHRTAKLDYTTSWGSFKSATIKYLANSMSFTGTFSNNEYLKTLTPSWYTGTGDSANSDTATFTSSVNTYVVNYKALLDAMKVSQLSNITSYSHSTALALVNAINNAENLNPNSYFTSVSSASASATECANAISSAITSINNAANGLASVDKDSYDSLATLYSSYSSLYSGNNSSSYYTDDSFAAFKNAYDSTTTVINNIANKSTYMTDATSTEDALENAFLGLKAAATYVDDTNLKESFVEYYNLNPSYYTESTYNALTTQINNALNYYNDNNYANGITLTDTPENNTIYSGLVSSVNTAFANLRMTSSLMVSASGSRYSLDSIIDEAKTYNVTNYSNGTDLTTAISAATIYKNNMATTLYENNQSVLYSNYVAAVQAVKNAINSLQKAFTLIDDGTIISQTVSSTDEVNTADSGGTNCNVRFFMKDAVRDTVLFKTTAAKASYTVPFDMTVTNGWYYLTWRAGARITGLGFGSTTATSANSTASSTTGASCAVALKWYDNTANDSAACGVSGSLSYHDALMQGECNGADASANFIDAVADTENQKIYGNATFTVPARTTATTTSRVYSVTTPTLYQSLYVNDSHGGLYSGANTTANVTLTVVDISDLLTYVAECDSFAVDNLGNASGFYTTSTWNAFTSAISAAKGSIDYKTMTADAIGTEVNTRLENLKSTRNALVEAVNKGNLTNAMTNDIVSTYKAGNNNYEWSTATWNTFKTAYETAQTQINADYSNVARYSSGTTNSATQNLIETTATALTTAFNQLLPGLADFTQLDAAVNALANSAQSGYYTTASVEAAANIISGLTYYNIADRTSINAEHQSDVDAETSAVRAISLTPITTDCLTNAITQAQNMAVDKDAYDTSAIANALNNLADEITSETTLVTGVVLTTVNYASQSALDSVVASILNNLQVKTYTVTVPDGVTCSETGNIPYGTEVTVSITDSSNVSWYMGFVSPTSELNSQYQATGNSYTFIVKGDTTITTEAAGEETFRVRYVNGINSNTYEVFYTTGEVTLAEPKSCAFYDFVNYTVDGTNYEAGAKVQINENTKIVANYTAQTTDGYDIYVNPLTGRKALISDTYNYNDRITLTVAGVYAWVAYYADEDIYKMFSYGDTLQFYVCETVDFTPYASLDDLNTDFFADPDDPEYIPDLTLINRDTVRDTGCDVNYRNAGVITANLATDGKATFVGQYVVPEDVSVVEYGFLVQKTASDTALTVENAGTDSILRCKATKVTVANQFVISVGRLTENQNIRYCTYLTYKTSSGTMNTIYSNTVNTTLIAE